MYSKPTIPLTLYNKPKTKIMKVPHSRIKQKGVKYCPALNAESTVSLECQDPDKLSPLQPNTTINIRAPTVSGTLR